MNLLTKQKQTYRHRKQTWLSERMGGWVWNLRLTYTYYYIKQRRREWQPTPVFLPGKFHGQRSLVGYSPWGHKSQTWLSNRTTKTHVGLASQVVQVVKNLPANTGDIRDTGSVAELGRSPGEGNGTCSSILAWRISWTEEPGGLQSMGSQRADVTEVTSTHIKQTNSRDVLCSPGNYIQSCAITYDGKNLKKCVCLHTHTWIPFRTPEARTTL